jgi:hypothetical protein
MVKYYIDSEDVKKHLNNIEFVKLIDPFVTNEVTLTLENKLYYLLEGDKDDILLFIKKCETICAGQLRILVLNDIG